MSPDTNSKNPSYLPPASIVKFAINTTSIVKFAINTTARSQFKVPATSMCSSLQKSSVFSMRLVPELAGSSSYSVRSPLACTVSRHSWLPCAQLPPLPHSSCPLEAHRPCHSRLLYDAISTSRVTQARFKITQVIHQSHRSTPATYVIQIYIYISAPAIGTVRGCQDACTG